MFYNSGDVGYRKNLEIKIFRQGRKYYHEEHWEAFSEGLNQWFHVDHANTTWGHWFLWRARAAAKRKIRKNEQRKMIVAEVK
jgi:hypothetical protein